MTTKLFKDGDHMAIQTDAEDEQQFLDNIASLFGALELAHTYEGDWEFQLSLWLPEIVDICCKYRGYKNGVIEKRVLLAGLLSPSLHESVGIVNERGDIEGIQEHQPHMHSETT